MELIKPFIGLIMLVIILVIMIPITNVILPGMVDTMGAQTGMMVELSIITIAGIGMVVFIKQMLGGEEHAYIQSNQM